MTLNSSNKPVLEETPEELTFNQPQFNRGEFDDSLFSKGYEVYLEKALRCPCTDKASGQGLPSCLNCGSTGFFFISKKKTRAAIQSINRKTKFSNWTEEDRGTFSVSLRGQDRIGFMDRITILDLVSQYSEVLRIKSYGDKLFAYTIYYPLNVSSVYLFIGDKDKLQPLILIEDYTIEENRIILDSKFNNSNSELSISVRYTHNPTYYILDIVREVTATRAIDCTSGEDYLTDMIINAVARKAHYLLDAPNVAGNSLYDNTLYDPDNIQNVLELLNPNSLLFQIINANAEQIQQALFQENNTAKITELKSLLP